MIQVDVFKLVIQRPRSPHFEKGLVNILRRSKVDKAVKLFALDCLFDDISIIVSNSLQHEALSTLDLFRQYSLMMREAASEGSPRDSPWLHALFQFTTTDGMHTDIQRGIFLFDHLQANKTLGDAGRSLLLGEFVRYMKRVLVDRLFTRTMKEESIFAELSFFNPYIWSDPNENGQRSRPAPRQDNGNQFRDRVQVHLQRIVILDTLYGISPKDRPSAWTKVQR